MENNRIITVVTRRTDGSFAEKVSVAINPEIPKDFEDVKSFAYNFMMHGKAKWIEIYEGTSLYFGDSRVKPIFSSREAA